MLGNPPARTAKPSATQKAERADAPGAVLRLRPRQTKKRPKQRRDHAADA